MRKSTVRRYIIVPLFYIAVLFALVMLQFSGGQHFREIIQGISITGTVLPGEEAKENNTYAVQDITVEYEGVSFPFSNPTSLTVTDSDGIETGFPVTGYLKKKAGLDLSFQGGHVLHFELIENESGGMRIIPDLVLEGGKKYHVGLPLSLSPALQVEQAENIPLLSISRDDKKFFLSLPGDSSIDLTSQTMELAHRAGTPSIINIGEVAGGSRDVFEFWYKSQDRKSDEQSYMAVLSGYIDDAYLGWERGRFRSATGTWQNKQGDNRFSEEALVSYLAESILRNEYTRALTDMRKAGELNATQLTFFSNTFLGNLQQTSQTYFSSMDLVLNKFERSLAQAKEEPAQFYRLFATADVSEILVYAKSPSLIRQVNAAFSQVDTNGISLEEAIHLLRFYHLVKRSGIKGLQLTSLPELIESHIFPSIINGDQGIFVAGSAGKVDLKLSILAGTILVKSAKETQEDLYSRVGRDLIISGLAFADSNGLLPSSLNITGSTISEQTGVLTPEELYPWLKENIHYPVLRPLYRSSTQTGWLWAIPTFTQITNTSKEQRFVFNFPAGRTHSLVINGIEPYTNLEILTFSWRITPRFELYSSGANYDPETKTLYIKYRNKLEQERIIITY